MLSEDRFFTPNPVKKPQAMALYNCIKGFPIVSPHGHIDPALFSELERQFVNLVEFLPEARRSLIMPPWNALVNLVTWLGVTLWLMSPASKFVTGIVVPVDGGFSAYSGV